MISAILHALLTLSVFDVSATPNTPSPYQLHGPGLRSNSPIRSDDTFSGVHEIRNPSNSPNLPYPANKYIPDRYSILRVKDENTLYSVVGSVAISLMNESVGTPLFLDKVSKSGYLHLLSSGNDGIILKVINITIPMAKDPFLIAQAIINLVLYPWYQYQISTKFQSHHILDSYHKCRDLVALLPEIRSHPDLRKFRVLYRILSYLFPTGNHNLHSNYALFYIWLYYNEYVTFISNGTLTVINEIGEGAQAVVFKLRSTSTNGNDTFLALKVYKGNEKKNVCQREEQILHKITRFNEQNPRKIAVPALIENVNGVSIRCKRQRSFLMQFIDGIHLKQSHSFTISEAVNMYSELKVSIERMGKMGITHNDIKSSNIMKDKEGKYWLIDFGHALLMDEYLEREDKKHSLVIGSWIHYSPDLYLFSRIGHLFTSTNRNLNLKGKRSEIEQLLIDGNLYSLQSVILEELLSALGEEEAIRKRMRQIAREIDTIHYGG